MILSDASFRVEPGQSLGILAPNGTGKTTLMQMMCGLEQPDEGKIVRSSRISFPLGSMAGIQNTQTAQVNARYIAKIYGLDSDYVESYCRWLADIDEYFEMPVATFSSGMKSRFGLALLLSLDFDFYLIDEGMPNSTDAEFNRKAGDVLLEKLKNSTVIIVSHKEQLLRRFVERAAVLRDGRLHFFDSLDDALTLYDFRDSENSFLFNTDQ